MLMALRTLLACAAVMPLEHGAVDVEAEEVGAEVVRYVKLGVAVLQQRGHLVGGHGVDKVEVAGAVGGVDGGIVGGEHQFKALHGDVFARSSSWGFFT